MLMIGHRGAPNIKTENTLGSFRTALRQRADMIEFDVRRTKDGKIVVMHDDDIRRTTDGKGLVRELTLKQIRKARTGDGERVPTLGEALDLLKGRAAGKIEIKSRGIEEQVMREVAKRRMVREVIIINDMPVTLRRVKGLHPQVKTELGGFRRKKWRGLMVRRALNARADILSPHYELTTKALVDECHENGLQVHVWTVNDKKTARVLRQLGVDGITTDRLDRIL